MKKVSMTVTAAACAALAVAVPDWKQSLYAAAYAVPVYKIDSAAVTQQVSVAGCKSLKTTALADVILYDDYTYTIDRNDWTGMVQGTWAKVPGKSSSTFYLSVSRNSLSGMLNEFDQDVLASCASKISVLNTLDPTMLISKNMIVVKVKDSAAKGTLQMKGKQENDSKGPSPLVVGNVSAKMTLTGTMVKL